MSQLDESLASELAIEIENDGQLYHQMIEPTAKNYARKMAKGTYDEKLALQGIRNNIVEEGIRRYKKNNDLSYIRVSKATKEETARRLLPAIKEYAQDIFKEKSSKSKKTHSRRRSSAKPEEPRKQITEDEEKRLERMYREAHR